MRSPPLPLLTSSVLCIALVAGVAASSGGASADPRDAGPPPVAAAIGDAPASRGEGEATLRDAVAGLVVTTLAAQFPDERVEVQLHRIEAQPVSIRDREVHGSGRMRFADGEWLPFGYRALYDTEHGSALSPRLTLGVGGAVAAGDGAPLEPEIGRAFGAEAARRVGDEFAGQPVAVRIESATGHALSARYLRIDATGTADFGAEGSTPARIIALYDHARARWLQFGYELGPAAPASPPAAVDLANR